MTGMNSTAMIAALILVPVVGLVTWALFAMTKVEKELGSLGGFEATHFEIGPQAAKSTEGAI